MLAAFTLAIVATAPEPLNHDGVTVDRARALDGQLVGASFIVAKPAYTLSGAP